MKQLMQFKKSNQTNTISFVSAWQNNQKGLQHGRKYDFDKGSQNVLFQFWLAESCWWQFEAWNWIYHKKAMNI